MRKDLALDLFWVLRDLKDAKEFWGRNGAIRFSRFITRFLKELDERKAILTRAEVYLAASNYAQVRLGEEKNKFLSTCWKILWWWDAYRAKQYAERLQDYCGLFAMTPEELTSCIRIYRNIGKRRKALIFVREALDRERIVDSQKILILIEGAEISESRGRTADAEKFYQQASNVGLNSYLDRLRFFLSYGSFELRRGNKRCAREALQEALTTAQINQASIWEKEISALLAQT